MATFQPTEFSRSKKLAPGQVGDFWGNLSLWRFSRLKFINFSKRLGKGILKMSVMRKTQLQSFFSGISFKVLAIILITSFLALTLLALGTFYTAERVLIDQLKQNIHSTIQVFLHGTTPALLFDDEEAANEMLQGLHELPHVLHASLFDAQGRRKGIFQKKGVQIAWGDSLVPLGTQKMEDWVFYVHETYVESPRLGSLFLVVDFSREMDLIEKNILYFSLLEVLGILFLIAILSIPLQNWLVKPIKILTQRINKVIESKDYSRRTKISRVDEVGSLATSFDQMLIKLERRDQEVEVLLDSLRDRNADLRQFIHVASHDLRSPLNQIQTLIEFIEEDLSQELSEDAKENFGHLHSRVQRLINLMTGLLQYSIIGSKVHKPEVIPLKEFCFEVLDCLGIPHGFHVSLPESMPTLFVDREPLRLVFQNLVSNAIKHHDAKEGHIEVEVACDEKCFRLAICDDGPGIEQKYQDLVFQMFQTLKSRDLVEGSGMGLALVKAAAGKMGARIDLVSVQGKRGCEFKVSWPKSVIVSKDFNPDDELK
jgi:signal transduction histidine kinase